MKKPVVILGCTASGKSGLGEALATELGEGGGTILAVDSMQVYRGMDIGTAKPDAATRGRIPHLMIDVADAWESYSAARFVEEARGHLEKVRPLVVVAGTFLYLRSLIEGLFEGPSADEAVRVKLNARAEEIGLEKLHGELAVIDAVAAGRIHPNDQRRIVRALEVYQLTGMPISTLQTQWRADHPPAEVTYIGIRWEKDALSRRINARVKAMMQAGLLEEVDRLRKEPRGFSQEAAAGVGYRQLLDYFENRCTLEEAVEQIKISTRYLAKMQRTWLKRWPPVGEVRWIEADEAMGADEILAQAKGILNGE